MTNAVRVMAALVLSGVMGPALAAGEDLTACQWANGSPIEPRLCAHMRQKQAEQLDKAAGERAELQRIADEDLQRQAVHQARQADEAARVRQAVVDQAAAQKVLSDQLARTRSEDDAADARTQAVRQARRAQCGDDYARPRVGMSMERARQCVGDLRLVSQANRADGVVSTYRAGRLVVHEMGGRIAAWSVY